MNGTRDPSRPPGRLWLALYRRLGAALPKPLREASLEAMVADLAEVLERERERKGRGAAWSAGLRAVLDLCRAVVRERRVAARGYHWERAAARRARTGMGETMMMWIRELRLAARSLLRRPGFAGVATVTLGLGIGATVAIFTLVNAVLIQPLDYPEPDRIVEIRHHAPAIDLPVLNNSPGTLNFYRANATQLPVITGVSSGGYNLTGADRPERIGARLVTPEFFEVFGVQPRVGRSFDAGDQTEDNTPTVAILTQRGWRQLFGEDPGVVGRTVGLDGAVVEIVGIMPEDFVPPGNADVHMLLPFRIDPDGPLGSFGTSGYARLAEGATLESARAQLEALQPRLAEIDPEITPEVLEGFGWSVSLRPMKEAVVGDVASTLWVVLGTVAFVLFIACANVANLFLVRAEGRQKELAIRAAVGAGRGQIAGGFLSESLVLGLAGGLVGLGVAAVGVRLITAYGAQNLPRLQEVAVTPTVLAFTALLSIFSALFLGSIPMARYAGRGFTSMLRDGNRTSTDGAGRHRARNLLVVSQLALALVLLVGSGLMFRSFRALQQLDLGFDPGNVLVVGVSAGDGQGRMERAAFYQAMIDRAAGLPGVVSAGFGQDVPLNSGNWSGGSFEVEGEERADDAIPEVALYRGVGPGYFETLGYRLVEGRTMRRSDWESGIPVVWVNEYMRDAFLDGEALGKRISWGDAADDAGFAEVVGVFERARESNVTEDEAAYAFLPMVAGEWVAPDVASGFLIVKTAAGIDPTGLVPELRSLIAELNPAVPVTTTRVMDEVVSASMADRSLTMALLGIATVVALFLGTIGLFGVVSYVVGQRRREIGVRIALGAGGVEVSGMVVRQGAAIVAVGIALGLVGAFALTRVLGALLYEVSATDPLTFVLAPALLLAVSLAATWVPARRASKVDPIEALRAE